MALAGSKRRVPTATWEAPLPDTDMEREMARVTALPLGQEAEAEDKLQRARLEGHSSNAIRSQPSASSSQPVFSTAKSGLVRFDLDLASGDAREGSERVLLLLFTHLPLLARIVDTLVGASPALIAVAATSSRWFCACHLVRVAAMRRRLECLDQALRFRAHPVFEPAEIALDNDVVDLEAATDLLDLDAQHLRQLMASRSSHSGFTAAARLPPQAAKMAATALFELLVAGRPASAHFSCNSGIWSQDRRILDPAVLLPLLSRFQRELVSQEAAKRLRVALCGNLGQFAPASVLQDDDDEPGGTESRCSDESGDSLAWRIAAAAVLQWAWVQLAHEELDPRAMQLGALEKALLLQPSLASRRIERRRETVLHSLNALRSDPLQRRLLSAPLEPQLPRRSLVQSKPTISKLPLNADTLAAGRLGCRQRSLPSLLGVHVGAAAPGRSKAEPSFAMARPNPVVHFREAWYKDWSVVQPLDASMQSGAAWSLRKRPHERASGSSPKRQLDNAVQSRAAWSPLLRPSDSVLQPRAPDSPKRVLITSVCSEAARPCSPRPLPASEARASQGDLRDEPDCSCLRKALGLAPKSPRDCLTELGVVGARPWAMVPPIKVSSHPRSRDHADENRPSSACALNRSTVSHGRMKADCRAPAWGLWRRPGSAPNRVPPR